MRNYDPHKNKVYEIEENVYRELFNEPMSDVFDEYEVEQFIRYIKSSSYFSQAGGCQSLSFSISNDGRRTANFYRHGNAHITLVPWGMNPMIICHEIAHHLTRQIAPDLPAHGTTFMSIYINVCFVASVSLGLTMLTEAKAAEFPLREDLNNANEIINQTLTRKEQFIHEYI